MQRYLAFYGHCYHPNGGMSDFLSDYDTIEEAILAIDKEIKKVGYQNTIEEIWDNYWAHIFDTESRQVVWSKNFEE
jgi:hypothetical protein